MIMSSACLTRASSMAQCNAATPPGEPSTPTTILPAMAGDTTAQLRRRFERDVGVQAAARVAGQHNVAAASPYQLAHDRQAEAGVAVSASGLALPEPVEGADALLLGHAGAFVPHVHV